MEHQVPPNRWPGIRRPKLESQNLDQQHVVIGKIEPIRTIHQAGWLVAKLRLLLGESLGAQERT
jgi:hypothetical protein